MDVDSQPHLHRLFRNPFRDDVVVLLIVLGPFYLLCLVNETVKMPEVLLFLPFKTRLLS